MNELIEVTKQLTAVVEEQQKLIDAQKEEIERIKNVAATRICIALTEITESLLTHDVNKVLIAKALHATELLPASCLKFVNAVENELKKQAHTNN